MSVDTWVNYWLDMHHEFDAAFTWHEFMAQAVTFYTPDMSPFLKRWVKMQIPILRRFYNSPLDGKPMYSVRLILPNSGHVLEVILSPLLTIATNRDLFYEVVFLFSSLPIRLIPCMTRFPTGRGTGCE